MDSNDKYKSNLSFIDLLFNILLGFAFLFFIAFIMINPVAKKSEIELKAEFLITMTWPNDNPSDFDLWVKDPQGRKIGFRNKDQGLVNLDRDDLGSMNDTVYIDGEPVSVPINKETVSIRGIVPGEYLVSVHLYRKADDLPKVPATVEVTKLNPYRIVYTQTLDFTDHGQALNYYKFTLNKNGEISNILSTEESAVGFAFEP
jgi:hypothetical protein